MSAFRMFLAGLMSLLSALTACEAVAADGPPTKLSLSPPEIVLRGQGTRQQLIATAELSGRIADYTRKVTYSSLTPEIVSVDEQGLVTGLKDGAGRVVVKFGTVMAEVAVQVVDAAVKPSGSLELDIIPILTRAGCNSGPCHGKARGQNGFQLSLLGFDPDFDNATLKLEARGRRLFLAAPETSLLLRKGAALEPHGGGKRIDINGDNYATFARWIAAGLPRKSENDPTLESVTVTPKERLMKPRGEQQLIITAHYSDGSTRDVTRLAQFQSNESVVVDVEDDGLVKAGPIPGEAAIMARYMGKIAIADILIPLEGEVPDDLYAQLPRYNFIDGHVWDKLKRLGITPSPLADDSKYVRRVYLDIIGRLPTPNETRAFLDETTEKKRMLLVDRLLERPEYAQHWANKWVDLLRPNPYRVGIKAVYNYDGWIRDAFINNKPYDDFVRDLLTAQGGTYRNGAVTMFRDRRTPDELTTIVSQLFLGVRLECTKCHHHPFEIWGQDDFYSFAAYFARVGHKGSGLSPPISGSEEMIFVADSGTVRHPLSGKVMTPRPLFGKTPEIKPDSDPRAALAEWLTSDENHFFAQVMVNRVWADMMGRGIVEPVDDLRGTNPPTNAALLESLADDFRAQEFDIKKLIRRIANSYVYALSSRANKHNIADTRNYSRSYRQRLRAEVLLDAFCDITEIPEEFSAMPPGSRAAEIWTHRVGSLFLDAFGRPDPNQDPPCERTPDTTVVQTLHLMNAPKLHAKVTNDKGRIARLAASKTPSTEIVEELYLLAYSRRPNQDEVKFGTGLIDQAGKERRQAIEDLLWALLNTPEFLFKD